MGDGDGGGENAVNLGESAGGAGELPVEKEAAANLEENVAGQARPDISPSSHLDTRCPSGVVEKIIYRTPPNFIQNLLIRARAKIQERRRKKLDKITALFEAKPEVASRDIQKLLRISSATAKRYMNILEKENKVIQVGGIGRGVLYVKKS